MKRFRGNSAAEKMGEIDLTEKEIRLVDTDWLEGDLLAHELAHYERYKKGNLINNISGHFGDFAIWTAVFFLSAALLNWFGILGPTLYNYIVIPALGCVIGAGVIAKFIEEHQAENMVPEMKEKYDLGVENSESD